MPRENTKEMRLCGCATCSQIMERALQMAFKSVDDDECIDSLMQLGTAIQSVAIMMHIETIAPPNEKPNAIDAFIAGNHAIEIKRAFSDYLLSAEGVAKAKDIGKALRDKATENTARRKAEKEL